MPPPGIAYHRLARTARHRWWRPVLGTLLVLGGLLALNCLLFAVAEAVSLLTDAPRDADGWYDFGPIPDTALLVLSIAVALPVVYFAAWAVQRRRPGTVSSVTGRLRWRWLGVCVLVAVPAVGALLLGASALAAATGAGDDFELTLGGWVGWPVFLAGMAMVLLLVPFQAAAEEYVFRGWLIQAIGAFLRNPWPAIGVQAVLFAAAHGWGTTWGFASLTVMGVVTGWLTVRTGGLEAAVALHVVNNVVAFGFSAATGTLEADETLADAPWQLAVVDSVVSVGFALVVLWLAGRRGLVTLASPALLAVPVPAGAPPVPAFGPGYPPASGPGYPPAGGGYPPAFGPGYPPAGGGYPPASGAGYPPAAGGGYPPVPGQPYPWPAGQQGAPVGPPPLPGQHYPWPVQGSGWPPGPGWPPPGSVPSGPMPRGSVLSGPVLSGPVSPDPMPPGPVSPAPMPPGPVPPVDGPAPGAPRRPAEAGNADAGPDLPVGH
ncbi:lysostaphin resistance A-like protein [Polymorphospora lycopeni]|uniref:Type II CAAX endopeptidase family protein n=1 Tax=Polymorphospora lycopeni TaxID=3140240 RepID=A0ABV5CVA7_9ACTN